MLQDSKFRFSINLWRALDSLQFSFSKRSEFLVELNKQRNVLKQISEPNINDGYFTCEIFWYFECDLSYSLYMQISPNSIAGVRVMWAFLCNIKNFTGIVCRIKRNYCMKFQLGVLNLSLRELAFGSQMKWALGTCTQNTSVFCRYLYFFFYIWESLFLNFKIYFAQRKLVFASICCFGELYFFWNASSLWKFSQMAPRWLCFYTLPSM